jgi:hypothetical protein
MRMRSLILGGAAAAAVILAAAGSASAATAGHAGGGGAAAITASPASLTFAPQVVGTGLSAPQTVTITNTASEPVYVAEADVDSYDFGISSAGTTCSNVTLAVGASCTVAVEFFPLSQGTQSSNAIVELGTYPHLSVVVIPVTGEALSS